MPFKLTKKRKKRTGDSSGPIKCINHWKDMEIGEFTVLLTKETQIHFSKCNVALISWHTSNNCVSRRPVIENKIIAVITRLN